MKEQTQVVNVTVAGGYQPAECISKRSSRTNQLSAD